MNSPGFVILRSNPFLRLVSIVVGSLVDKIKVSGRLSGKWRSCGLVWRL